MHDRPFRPGNFRDEGETLGPQGKGGIANATPLAQSSDFFRTMGDD
jgi:hypothetical protein